MGAWGVLAFDNDTACDWGDDLEDAEDLTPVETAFEAVEDAGEEYLDQDLACEALAAAEVLARLGGRRGYGNAYTETVDAWVKAHPQQVSKVLTERALKVIERIDGEASELAELWDEANPEDAKAWRASLKDLAARVRG